LRLAAPSARLLHSSGPLLARKPAIASIAALRQRAPGTSMLKAREAIASTWSSPDAPDDLDAALEWLRADQLTSGAAKASKVASRTAREGLVAIVVLADGVPGGAAGAAQRSAAQAAIVELNCETDFVGRTDLFTQLARDVAHTAALFPSLADVTAPEPEASMLELPLEAFLSFPLLSAPAADAAASAPQPPQKPQTVQEAILDAVARLGERIRLARASAVVVPSAGPGPRKINFTGAYAHGANIAAGAATRPGSSVAAGRVGSLVLSSLQPSASSSTEDNSVETRALARSLARQAAGFPTKEIRGSDETALYAQPFSMALAAAGLQQGETPVGDALRVWAEKRSASLEVLQLARWELGETDTDATSEP
jgi:elongation factor Ts